MMYEAYVSVTKLGEDEVELSVTVKARTVAELSRRVVAHIALFDDERAAYNAVSGMAARSAPTIKPDDRPQS